MTKLQKANIALQVLDKLYPNPSIPLRRVNNFTFLVAVMLSAQCRDDRVNEVTKDLFKIAPTPQKMLELGVEGLGKIIKPCGLWRNKAKNIIATSLELVSKYAGRVPPDMEKLEALPGVGHKTASVMMIQAFNTPAFPVDTHIHRLAARWGLSDGKSVEKTERDLKKLFPEDRWAKLHLQMIYYGREHCKASSCKTPQTYCRICKLLRK